MAEGVGLENRYTLTGIVGSNPTLSVKSVHQEVALPNFEIWVGATR